jgi:ribosomal protein S18 acetylase RimI-like enzyme
MGLFLPLPFGAPKKAKSYSGVNPHDQQFGAFGGRLVDHPKPGLVAGAGARDKGGMPPPLAAAADLALALRPETGEDAAFVAALFASVRGAEFAAAGWPPEQLQAFLDQQNDLQRRHYRASYDGAEWLIVEADGERVGRLYLQESASEVRIIDISLMPWARGRGLGGALLADVLAAAGSAEKMVSLHVEPHNPAVRLYSRLGFETVDRTGVYLRMEWRPDR